VSYILLVRKIWRAKFDEDSILPFYFKNNKIHLYFPQYMGGW